MLHLRFGRFELDEARHQLLADGQPVAIGPKPLALLVLLARHRERVVRKDELLRALWPDVAVTDDSIAQAVLKAREALGEVGSSARILTTVRGVGFRFAAHAEAVADAAVYGAETASGSLVGRAHEIGLLRSALARALAGGGRLVLVMGEAGIGKTRLAEELASIAERAGADVHWASGQDAAGTPSFWLWAQVLGDCADSWEPARLRDLLGAGATDLGRLAPALREQLAVDMPAPADTEESRFRLIEALRRFLQRAARARPQVLVVDDLQWLDLDSLRSLARLAADVRRERLLVVATVRDDDLARSEALQDVLVAWEKCDALDRVPLAGLLADGVARLVEQQAAVRPIPEVAAALQRRTGGNPLFVRQIVGLAAASGAETEWITSVASLERVALPIGVRRVASRRLEALSATARALLELAACVGREFPLALLGRAAECDRAALLRSLDAAVAARVLVASGGTSECHAFSHDVVREVLLAELPPSRRAALHLRLAHALESLHAGHLAPVVPALAYHYAEAAPLLDGAQAVDYAKWAGDLARGVTAFDAAAEHYERALRALDLAPGPNAHRRAELLVSAGWAHQSAGHSARARRLLEEGAAVAGSVGHAELFAMAALGFAEFFVAPGSARAVALLREALARLEDRPGGLRVWIASALAIQLVGDDFNQRDEAERLAAEAETTARSHGGARSLAAALLARAFVARTASGATAQSRNAWAQEAAGVVHERGELTLEVMASLAREVAWMDLGERDAADVEIARLEHLLGRLQSSYWRAVLPALRATRALLDARFEEAEALARAAFAAADLPTFPYELSLAAVLGAIRFEQGRGGELVGLVDPLLRRYGPYPVLRAAQVFALAEAGRADEARRALRALAEQGFDRIGITDNWPFTLSLLARACHALGDAASARPIAALLAPRASECIDVSNGHLCGGPIALQLALLAITCGDPDEAERHLAIAAERARSLRSPLHRAWALAVGARAAALRRSAEAHRCAVERAAAARALAIEHGMPRLLRELDDLPS